MDCLADNAVASGSRLTERFHPDPAHLEWTVWGLEQVWGGTAVATRKAVIKLDGAYRIKAVAATSMDGIPTDEQYAFERVYKPGISARFTTHAQGYRVVSHLQTTLPVSQIDQSSDL